MPLSRRLQWAQLRRWRRRLRPDVARRRRLERLESRDLLAASLSGRVFEDLNGNQRWDQDAPGAEPVLECWDVYLDLNQDGARQDNEPTQRTTADGKYRFDNLAPGEYRVDLVAEPGYNRTTPIRLGETTSLIAAAPRDQVFDPIRSVLYITSGDRVLRRDPKSGATLASLAIGNSLTALDLTPDGRYLLVGEQNIDIANGLAFLYKIDLNDNFAVTTISYGISSAGEGGLFDIVAVSSERALFTGSSASGGPVPLREVNLSSNVVTARTDTFSGGPGQVRANSRLDRNLRRDAVLLLESDAAAGPVYLYDPLSNSFPRSTQLNTDLGMAHVAISRDGKLFALETDSAGLTIWNDQFGLVQTLPHLRGGVGFDPVRDILYAGDTASNELVALRTDTWQELDRVAAGEDLPGTGVYYEMQFSVRGGFLSWTTPSGVRLVRLDRPAAHRVTVGVDAMVRDLDFGNWWNGENRRPRAFDDAFPAVEDTTLQVPVPGVLANDSDPDGHALAAVIESAPLHGSLQIAPGGSFTYTPFPDYFGPDQFTYRARDAALSSCRAAIVSLQVAPVNDAPTGITVSNTRVNENAAGAALGSVVVADVDTDDQHTFTLSDARFEVSGGILRLKSGISLDYEAESTIPLVVTATDNGSPPKSISVPVTVLVTDVNEFDPVIAVPTPSLMENAAAGTVVGRVTATDGDTAQSVTYAIVGGSPGGAFEIHPVSGLLTVANSTLLDYETRLSLELTVSATDNGSPPRTSFAAITVQLIDQNEFAPEIGDAQFLVDENSTLIGRVAASDGDRHQSITYAFFGDPSLFAIHPATGEIRVADGKTLDYERSTQHVVTVVATDSGSPSLSGYASVVVLVRDVNEFAPVVADHEFRVPENPAGGWHIGRVVASDADSAQSLTYLITSGNESGTFMIDVAQGDLFVVNGALIDRELNPQFTLGVEVFDSGVPSRSAMATVTILVEDQNEFPPVIDDATFSVPENSPSGTVVGTVDVHDDDAGGIYEFAIIGGSGASVFEISSSGQIKVVDPFALDFETQTSFLLIVEVREVELGGGSDRANITILVVDVNEAPTDISLDDDTVSELVPGAFVGNVAVDDPDRNDRHTFVVDDSRFEVTSRQELKLKSGVMLRASNADEITIHITAIDKGGASCTEAFVIYVTGSSNGNGHPWQNPRNPRDVNDDGAVTPQDVLVVINEINNPQHSDPDGRLHIPRPDIPGLPYYDVNGDGFVTVIDVLIIINWLNVSTAEGPLGEGEPLASVAAPQERATGRGAVQGAAGLPASILVPAPSAGLLPGESSSRSDGGDPLPAPVRTRSAAVPVEFVWGQPASSVEFWNPQTLAPRAPARPVEFESVLDLIADEFARLGRPPQ